MPTRLDLLTSLHAFDVANTSLSGTLPTALPFETLVYFFVSNTSISGTIPTTLCMNATRLLTLALDSNHITGTIPSDLSGLTSLKLLSLHTNRLSGTLPSMLAQFVQMQYFDAGSNLFDVPRHPRYPGRYRLP